jgi:predicted 3-demethylubiquinone-9 3-methyltransferase (glyoxalase superfamily)
VLTVGFQINGQPFTALSGWPAFKFNKAISFQVFCDSQKEIDDYWNMLTAREQARVGGSKISLAFCSKSFLQYFQN